MKSLLKKCFRNWFFLRFTFTSIKHPKLILDLLKFKNESKTKGKEFFLKDLMLIPNENTEDTDFDSHYIYHPAWAARILKTINPEKHVDISSKLTFCTMLSAFIATEFYDFRPAHLNLTGLTSGKADLCNLHFADNSITSLSCMHVIEHIGLGRYGDPINVDGDKIAANELQRVLAVNGNLLFVTPVGQSKIQFNAHRIYSFNQVLDLFSKLTLIEFSIVPDDGIAEGIINNADPDLVINQNYACGCFWFTKNI